MPLRPEDLPREVDRLIALAVELSAENEQLRDLVKAANAQAYGPRSERASLILEGQAPSTSAILPTRCRPPRMTMPRLERRRSRPGAHAVTSARCLATFRGLSG